MTFFEELSKKVYECAKAVGNGAEKIYERSKKSLSVYSQKEKVTELYKKLGEYVYENRNCLGENEIGSLLREIDVEYKILEKLIHEKSEKFESEKKYKICTCGYKSDASFEYCPKCGKMF